MNCVIVPLLTISPSFTKTTFSSFSKTFAAHPESRELLIRTAVAQRKTFFFFISLFILSFHDFGYVIGEIILVDIPGKRVVVHQSHVTARGY